MRPLHSVVLAALLSLLNHATALAGPPQIDWAAAYNGPGSYWDAVGDATVHGDNLYVVGFTTMNSGVRGYITVKYAADGTEEWSRIYEGFVGHHNEGDQASAVTIDAAENVYVTGYSTEADSTDLIIVDAATLKYSPDGNLLWERRYRGSGGNVQPSAIALDSNSFLYVSGSTWINGGFDVFLLKYDQNGNLLWSRTHGIPGGHWDASYTMSIDANGNIVLGGYTQPGILQDLDIYILKYKADGSFLWEWSLQGTANVEEVWDVAADAQGNTYAIAQYAPPTGQFISLLTVKLSPSGALLWSDIYSGQSTGDYAAGVEISPDGNIYSAGAAWENGSQDAMHLIKYTPNGQRLWVRSERGGFYSAECNDLAVGSDGAAYLTGFAFNDSDDFQYLTVKYDAAGNLIWTAPWAAIEGRTDIAYQVRVGADQRVYVVGDAWRGFARYFDITTVVYDQSTMTGVEVPASLGGGEMHIAARPNPTQGETVLDFYLPRREEVSLSIYDASGRMVRNLQKGPANAGAHSLTWDGRGDGEKSVAPGVYFIRLESAAGEAVSRITRIR